MTDSLLGLIANSPLFTTGDQADIQQVLQAMRPVHFSSGQLVFSAGDPGDGLYLVTRGRIKLSILTEAGQELSVAHATAGDIFGEIAALDGAARTTDATALSQTEAMFLSRADYFRVLAARPALTLAATRFLCRRLRQTNDKLEGLALHSLEVRLARHLLAELEKHGSGAVGREATLDIDMSQTDLALLIGASRPKVNGAITRLEEEGAIRRAKNLWTINLVRLRRCALLA